MLIIIWPPISSWADNERPSFHSLRYQEDYRFLKNQKQGTDFFDPLKYIPINSSGSLYLTLGGETRQHFEFIDNNNWGKGTQDGDGYYLQRYLGHADVHVGDRTRLFFQLMAGVETGRNGGPRGVDKDSLAVNQGFIDFKLWDESKQSFTLRAGRQEIVFGSRRFFNYRERPNMRLSHDAVNGIFRKDKWDVRAFLVRPATLNPHVFDNDSGPAKTVWGRYGVRKKLPFSLNADLY
ncbi:MAG: alginate export family protein, partial [Nitrospinae bacterium]|nr:alginate export family protein [Nitrospinota bacterium]